VNEKKPVDSTCGHEDESTLASTFVDYEDEPREYRLSSINAVLNVHTRVSDLDPARHVCALQHLRKGRRARRCPVGPTPGAQSRTSLTYLGC
jgi:hypothetical protein